MFHEIPIDVLLAKPVLCQPSPMDIVGKWYYPFTPVPMGLEDEMCGSFQVAGIDYIFHWAASDAVVVEAVA